MKTNLTLTPTQARRQILTRQHLTQKTDPVNDAQSMLEIVRDLGCLQIDPTNTVARTHLLVLWSRMGCYDPAHLDTLLWQERQLFEYWAHAASMVLTEDYPIHQYMMRRYGEGASGWHVRVREWVAANGALRDLILDKLRAEGPLPSRAIEDTSTRAWRSSGWSEGRNVGRMLDFLWTQGTIMVAGRKGQERLWDLAERCLPDWTPRETLTEEEVTRLAIQKSLRALGIGRAAEIKRNYTRDRYPHFPRILADLIAEERIVPLKIAEGDKVWPDTWYLHADDLPLLETSEAEWQPRTTLLSPFDNLICDRKRTETLFDFESRPEIYTPKEKRKYGFYVLPILHGDQLIGRIDPIMDRKKGRLTIQALHWEPNLTRTTEIERSVTGAIEDLALFLGATEIDYAAPK